MENGIFCKTNFYFNKISSFVTSAQNDALRQHVLNMFMTEPHQPPAAHRFKKQNIGHGQQSIRKRNCSPFPTLNLKYI